MTSISTILRSAIAIVFACTIASGLGYAPHVAFAVTCTTDTQCATGQLCVSGTCKAPAASTGGNPDGPIVTGGNTDSAGGSTIANPLKVDSLTGLLDIILKAVVQIGAVILTLALIWTGFKFVAARGNPEAITSARTALLWTIIGGLILLGAQAIETVIQSTVGAL